MKQRCGVSLVELLLTMSACTVILTMSAALLHRVMHTQSKIRAFDDAERSALRLSSAFRRDVRQAASAAADATTLEGQMLVRLTFSPDEIVEYRQSEGSIVRVQTRKDQPTAREAFVFPSEIDVAVRQTTPKRWQLTIKSRPPQAGSLEGETKLAAFMVPVSLHVEATLNGIDSQGRPVQGQEDAP